MQGIATPCHLVLLGLLCHFFRFFLAEPSGISGSPKRGILSLVLRVFPTIPLLSVLDNSIPTLSLQDAPVGQTQTLLEGSRSGSKVQDPPQPRQAQILPSHKHPILLRQEGTGFEAQYPGDKGFRPGRPALGSTTGLTRTEDTVRTAPQTENDLSTIKTPINYDPTSGP